jgi:hypothetical protein
MADTIRCWLHREASGVGELHEKMADLFGIQSGDATVVGGESR